MNKSVLIVFAKNPELGKVKTRLAASLGDQKALSIYQQLLQHTKKQIEDLHSIDVVVYYSDRVEHNDLWDGFEKKCQIVGDLGEKMKFAIEEELKQYQKVCIVGTDCAELSAAVLSQAFDALEGNDFVLGPANDGGYYLLGMQQMQTDLFYDMTWSTDQVLEDTLQRITAQSKTYFRLPELIDVDTFEDWEKVSDRFI